MSKIVKKVTSAVALSAIAFSIVGSASGVNAAYTGLDAANKLATMGVIVDQSTNASNYRLGDTITRKELAKVVAKLGNVTVSEKCEGKFADLKSTDWGCKYAEALLAAGYVSANTNFRPMDEVSKAEALKMVMKARGIEKSSNSNWQAAYVEGAVAAGVAEAFSDYNVSGTRGVIFTWAVNEESSDDDLLGDLIGDLDDTSTGTTDEDTTVTPTTGGTLTVSLSPETPTDGLAPAKTPRVSLLSFDINAGEADSTLSAVTLEFVGLGNYANLDQVAVYNSKGEKVSKVKDFSDVTREIYFDKDIIVKAGETETFTVAGYINDDGSNNATYGVKLIDLKASGDVEGGELLGALLVPVVSSNTAKAELRSDAATGKVTIGKDSKLAGFELKETSDKEDVVVKTLSFHLEGGVDADSFSNLAVYADGKEVAADLSFNSSDDLVAAVNYEVAANDAVTFELRGVVTGDVNKTFTIKFDDADDVYAVGKKTGFNVAVSKVVTTTSPAVTAASIADANRQIEGSEISVSFAKGDQDEARPDSSSVKLGTLKMLAASEGYTVKKVTVTVTSATTVASTGGINTVLKNLKLGGSTEDTYTEASTSSASYIYKDIDLSKSVSKDLDLVADIENNTALNGRALSFDIQITEVKDEDNNETYTVSADPKLSTILSTNSFNKKTLTINTATFTLSKVAQNAEQVVLGSQELVVYRAKVSVGDSDSVKVKKFKLTKDSVTSTYTGSLDDIIDSATLKIGNVEIGEDNIDSDSIDFNNVATIIAAGEKNVPVTVVAKLKNKDNLSTAQTVELKVAVASDVSLSDSDSNDVANPTIDTGKTLTLTIRDHGKLTVNFNTEEDKTALTDVNKVVLAGRTGVQLAKMKLDAEYEESKVKNMVFTLSGSADFSDTLTNIKLVSSDGVVLATGPVVTYSAPNTKVEFKNDFTLPMAQTYAYLVADVNVISDAGTAVASKTGAFNVSLATSSTDLVVEGGVSADAYTAGTELTTPTITTKNVTVAANSVAGVTLASSISSISAQNGAVIGKVTVDTESQTFNKANNGKDVIEALLKKFQIEVASSNVTVTNLKLSRSGKTVSFSGGVLTDVTASLTGTDLIDFATIDDGKATFDIIADLAAGADITKATLNIKIADVSTGIVLDDGSKVTYTSGVKAYVAGTEVSKVFSSKTATADKQVTVDIKN